MQEVGDKRKLFILFLKPLLISIMVGLFCFWLNSTFSFNDRGVLIANLIASFILIFPSYFMIKFLGDKHKVLRTLLILAVIFVGIPMVGYFSDTNTLFRANLLKNTVIYDGPMPEPQAVVLPTGEMMSWFVGQVNLFIKPETSIKEIERLVSSVNGEILTKIPTFGYYLIGVSKNFEDSVASLEAEKFVLEVEPNFMIVPAGEDIVDLTDTGKDLKELTTPFLTSPEPGAGVITVEIDMFKGSHGEAVNGVREVMGSRGPVLQIDVGGVKCGESYCSSTDRVYSALSAVLAGAEMNRQKVVISIALSVMPLTKDPAIFSKKNGEGSNSWATTQWESFAKGILKIVETSEWAKKDNVTISQAAGNGACLIDKNNLPLNCTGIDLSELMVFNLLEEKNINVYGVEEKGRPVNYSNHGKGIIMKEIPEGSRGTSMASAQGWAETEKVWKANPRLGSKEIKTKLTKVVCPGGLQVCINSCIPTNAECCNSNVYCIKPGGSCTVRKMGTCSICPVGQKFCGMFCVGIDKECQKQITEEEFLSTSDSVPAKTGKTSNQNNLMCNGKSWSPCGSDEQFYCPAKGDPYCDVKGKILCNGEYWDGCNASEDFQCFPEGAMCVPNGVTLEPLCAGKRNLPCDVGYHFICVASGGICEPNESQQQLIQQPIQESAQQTPSPFEGKSSCQIKMEAVQSCRAGCVNQNNICNSGCGSDGNCIVNCEHQGRVCYNACYGNCDGL